MLMYILCGYGSNNSYVPLGVYTTARLAEVAGEEYCQRNKGQYPEFDVVALVVDAEAK